MSSSKIPPKSRLAQATEWFEDRWPEVLTTLSAAIVVIASIWVELPNQGLSWILTIPGALVVVFASLSVFGSIIALRKVPALHTLQKQIQGMEAQLRESSQAYFELRIQTQHDLSEVCRHLLICIASDLNLGITERISIYKHEGTNFLLLERWSADTVYVVPGRTSYPDNEGVISEAWRLGEIYKHSLPDINRKSGQDAYYRQQQVLGVPLAVAQRFRMKSRSYYGLAIHEPRGVEKVAVVIVESTLPNLPNRDALRPVIQGQSRLISQFVEKMTSITPPAVPVADLQKGSEG